MAHPQPRTTRVRVLKIIAFIKRLSNFLWYLMLYVSTSDISSLPFFSLCTALWYIGSSLLVTIDNMICFAQFIDACIIVNLSCLGCKRLVKEHLNWQSKSELKADGVCGIKEIGTVLYLMGLLDIVLVCITQCSVLHPYIHNYCPICK